MKIYSKKSPDVISFSEALEAGIPEDLLAFAAGTQHRAPMAIEGLRRDRAVRQYMREHGLTDYFKAFQVVALGYDAADVFAAENSHSVARRRSAEVASRLAQALAGTMAVRDEG